MAKWRSATVSRLVDMIRESGLQFDTIAVTGMSGALIGGEVASRLGKDLTLVRKPDDDSHASDKVEGPVEAKTYIFVDDQIDSGETVTRVLNTLSNRRCLGVFLYNGENYEPSRGLYNVRPYGIDEHQGFELYWFNTRAEMTRQQREAEEAALNLTGQSSVV